MIHHHPVYGYHSVLTVGYVDFTYGAWSDEPNSTYIRIADGWTKGCNRYVWGNCYGSWNYVSVIPDI